MLKIAEMEYIGANSIFLRLLLDKKYALPFRVLDALVAHFLSFRTDKQTLPVLWHQSLLTLVQRYKADLSSEQKEALLELLKCQTHVRFRPRSGASCKTLHRVTWRTLHPPWSSTDANAIVLQYISQCMNEDTWEPRLIGWRFVYCVTMRAKHISLIHIVNKSWI